MEGKSANYFLSMNYNVPWKCNIYFTVGETRVEFRLNVVAIIKYLNSESNTVLRR